MSPTPNNHMLSSLLASDLALLEPHLESIEFPLRQVFEQPNKPIKAVCFPHSGILSVVALVEGQRKIEVGVIGRDGMSGLSVVNGDDRAVTETFAQMAGAGSQISTVRLKEAMERSTSLRLAFLRYANAFAIQTTYTALANGKANVLQRLARWLLIAHDRTTGNELSITHEFLSLMLGVRRSGVTVALQKFQKQGLVRYARGSVLILNRAGLERLADDFYSVQEAEQFRLTGWRGKGAKATTNVQRRQSSR